LQIRSIQQAQEGGRFNLNNAQELVQILTLTRGYKPWKTTYENSLIGPRACAIF